MGRDHSSGHTTEINTLILTHPSLRKDRAVLTDEFESEVFVGSRLFGMFVQEHDGASDPAVLQSLLTHAGQLQRANSQTLS